jgi:DNA-binding CsgD family transcriptional regulator
MDIASTLADLTGTLSSATQIAPYLSKVLDLDCMSVVVVGEAGGPHVLLQSASGAIAESETLSQDLLAIYQQTKPLTTSDGPTLRSAEDGDLSETAVQRLAAYPRAIVLARTLDAQFRMLLIVHQGAEDPALVPGVVDLLQLVTDELAKLLGALVSWRERLEHVGEPFDRLTDREWVVLQGLTTEAGEKQLADQLGLSPHTLHSHIKSIYRKVEVQGRLPLLTKVKGVMRDRRLARLNCPKEPLGETLAKAAANAG